MTDPRDAHITEASDEYDAGQLSDYGGGNSQKSRKATTKMACDCIEQMNEKLAPKNARLAITFGFGGPRVSALPTIEVEKIDSKKRGSLPLAIPTFCPFCGVSYAEPAEAPDHG